MYHFPALITLLSLSFYFFLVYNVGSARRKHKIAPPAMNGPEEFERYVRVQANTAEQLIIFLPALWICAVYMSSTVAGVLGCVWLVARVFYAFSYYKESKKRLPPFLVSILISSILLLLGFGFVLKALFTQPV